MDIQRIKTALLRALLDNAYLANHPRTEVAESHASETTLDDLLVARPGGIVRTKMPGGLSVIQHPDVGGHVFPLLQYQDATREWRTGVSRQGQGVDPNALQNQVATIANQMFNAAQAKLKLIARIFAETGIRDLFLLLHAVIRKHGGAAQTVRLRNQWVTIDPRDWKTRNDMTINVGLGTGGKSEQLSHLTALIGLQKEALAAGKGNLVSDANLYNSAKEFVKLVGLKNTDAYFTNPAGQPPPAPPAPPADPTIAEAQGRLALEHSKAAGLLELDRARLATDGQHKALQLRSDMAAQRERMQGELALKREQMAAEFALKREQMMAEMELRREQLGLEAKIKQSVAATRDTGMDPVRIGGEVG